MLITESPVANGKIKLEAHCPNSHYHWRYSTPDSLPKKRKELERDVELCQECDNAVKAQRALLANLT